MEFGNGGLFLHSKLIKGALLYEMLTGAPPFYSKNTKEMWGNIIEKQIPMPKYLSANAKQLLRGLLARKVHIS